jgi:hypothetical protein
MSMRLVWCSATGAPTPTPALLTSTSRRPKRSRCASPTRWMSASSVRFEAPVTRAARSGGGLASFRSGTRYPIMGMRTPFAVMAVLLVVLVGIGLATEGGETTPTEPPPAPVAVIARRVEALRQLRYKTIPKPVAVSAASARREGLADLDREYPAARRHADEQVLKMLGLIAPDADLRELTGSLFEQGVAGYYDPRDGRLRVVTGAGTGTRVLTEMTLAHELTHALEDQRFGLDTDTAGGDDRMLARTALIEGTATALMYAYVQRYFTSEETLGGLLGAAFQDTGGLPPFLEAQVLFPYVGGNAFVDGLLRRAGGRWSLVNLAYEAHPPVSTEQILHLKAYFDAEAPEAVRLRAAAALGKGWTRAAAGTWGELQTRELLGSARAAAGWGGDRYELWRSAAGVGDALVMRWRWDTPRDEREFLGRLRDWVHDKLGAQTTAVVDRGGAVTLAIAPDARLAARLAGA